MTAAIVSLLAFWELRGQRRDRERLERLVLDESARSRDELAKSLRNFHDSTLLAVNGISENHDYSSNKCGTSV